MVVEQRAISGWVRAVVHTGKVTDCARPRAQQHVGYTALGDLSTPSRLPTPLRPRTAAVRTPTSDCARPRAQQRVGYTALGDLSTPSRLPTPLRPRTAAEDACATMSTALRQSTHASGLSLRLLKERLLLCFNSIEFSRRRSNGYGVRVGRIGHVVPVAGIARQGAGLLKG